MNTEYQRPEKFCHACGDRIHANAIICPKCRVAQPTPPAYVQPPSYLAEANSKKTAAGLCGIFFGLLGIHKFILGYTTAGIIMLLVTVLTLGLGGLVMGIIGLVEGIIYLTKSDEEFYQTYMAIERQWF